MALTYKITPFEELLKKASQPKAPTIKATGDLLDPDSASELGYKIPTDWKLGRDITGTSLISPRGLTWRKTGDTNTIADFKPFSAEGKPIKLPLEPPPEPPLEPPPEELDRGLYQAVERLRQAPIEPLEREFEVASPLEPFPLAQPLRPITPPAKPQQVEPMDTRGRLQLEEGISLQEFKSLTGMTLQEYGVASDEGRVERISEPGETLMGFTTPEGEQRVRIRDEALSLHEKILRYQAGTLPAEALPQPLRAWVKGGEAVTAAGAAPLFEVAGVPISAFDITALALISFGIYQVGTAGWNTLLNKVLRRPGDLNWLGRQLTKAGLNRNLDIFERQYKVKIPTETRNNFINRYLNDMAASWERMVGSQVQQGTANIQSLQLASQATYAQTVDIVNREIQTLIPGATQTGAMALGGLPAEQLPTIQAVVQKIMNNQALTLAERQLYANQAQEIESALQAQVTPPVVVPTEPTAPPTAVAPPVTPEVTRPTVDEALAKFEADQKIIQERTKYGIDITKVTEAEYVKAGLISYREAVRGTGFPLDIKKQTGILKGEYAAIPKAEVTPPVTPVAKLPAVEVAKPPVAPISPVTEEVSAIPPTAPAIAPKVAPPVEVEPVIPPTEPIAKGVISNTQGMRDLGIKEKVRPARKVLTRIGQWRELFKPTQRAEVELHEEQVAKSKMFDEWQKLLGTDKARWALVSDEINKKGSVPNLTASENRVVAEYRKWADEWANRKDLPQTKRIRDYMPHLFEQEATRQITEEGGIDPVLAQMLSEKVTRKITDPFLKKRLGAVGWIKDPVAAARAYEAVSLKFAYYTPLLNKIDTILADPSIPQSVKNYLSGYSKRMTGELSEIDKSANITIREFAEKIKNVPVIGRFLYPRMTEGNPIGMASYHFTGGLYGLFLGFKATSAIRNLSQHTLILGEVGSKHFADGIRLRLTKEGKGAMKKSLVLRSRKFAYTAGLDSSFASRWTDKFRETALYMFRLADRQNVSDAFLAGYSEAKGFFPETNEQVWIDRGDEVAADTQYLYTKMNSMSFSQSAPGRTMSMLTTWTENWMELMTKWIKRTPSQVYLEQERLTGKAIPAKNWSQTYKAIGLYMALVGLAFAFDDQTRLKIKEYTGIGSLRYLAGAVGGEFPAMEAIGSVADMVAGFLTDDERMFKSGLAEFKSTFTPGIIRQLGNVGSGEKDWSTLLFYLEAKDFQIKNLKDEWEKEWKEYPVFETPEDKTEYIKTHPKHKGWSDAKIRNQWREDNPILEAQMFVVGRFTILSSDKARAEVLRLIEKHKLDTELINGYEKVFGIDTKAELKTFEDRIGNLEDLVAGEEPKYFTTGNYVSEVNKLVTSSGRAKVQKEASPLTKGILEAQDTVEGYEVLEEGDARTLWRRQYPEAEAWMCLMSKVQSPTTLKSAETLQGLVEKYDIPINIIPAFQLTDEGKERIPSNRDLWGHYFFYYDLPGTSYLNMTQGQVDSGQLPEKYYGEWETYQKLKTDTAKSAFRRGHGEAAYGNWRDDFRRDNIEFDQWLQDEKGLKPLPKKVISRPRAGARRMTLAGAEGFGLSTVSPRRAKATYPAFPKARTGISIRAPSVPGF